MADVAATRTYGGVGGAQRTAERRTRLLAAGVELLGAEEPSLTVRGVCKQSGLIARYFYENFSDTDALAVAVHEQVITDLVTDALTQLADVEAEPESQLRVGLTAIVNHLAADSRRGRILFVAPLTQPALVARRPEVVSMFAGLLRTQAGEFVELPEAQFDSTARFLVGGFGEVLTSWQDGSLTMSQDDVIEQCITLFRGIVATVIPRTE